MPTLGAIAAMAVAGGGCGATPPQAPRLQAQKLDESLSGISTACGQAYQVTQFGGPRVPDLRVLESVAAAKGRELASVYGHNPAWIYQGETVRAIVGDAVSALTECGLTRAAAELRRATAK